MADSVPTISAGGSSPQKTTGRALLKSTKAPKPKAKAHGVPTSGERLAQWLANPGLRSKLPDSALTPDLLASRQQNAYNASPAAPGSGYTNKQLGDLVGMLTQQKYGGAELALKQQGQALTDRATTQIPAWFQAYRDQVGAARAGEQQADAARVASLNQMATTAAGDTGGLAGAPMDAAGAARAQAAAQIRSAGIGNQAALAQNLAGNQDAFLANLGLLSNPQQQAAQLAVGKQQNDLAGQVAQLASDKGTYKTTQRQQILSDESDSALKAALTQAQTKSTDANTAATKASTTKTKISTKKSKADQDYFDKHGYYPGTGKPANPDSAPQAQQAAKAGYTSAEWAKMTPAQRRDALAKVKPKGAASDKDPYGNTPKQQQASTDALDKALIYARQAVKDKKHGPGLIGDWKKLANALVVGFNVNPQYARAAAQQVVLGHLGPNTTKTLKRRGTKIPKPTKPVIASMTDEALSSVGETLGGIGQ